MTQRAMALSLSLLSLSLSLLSLSPLSLFLLSLSLSPLSLSHPISLTNSFYPPLSSTPPPSIACRDSRDRPQSSQGERDCAQTRTAHGQKGICPRAITQERLGQTVPRYHCLGLRASSGELASGPCSSTQNLLDPGIAICVQILIFRALKLQNHISLQGASPGFDSERRGQSGAGSGGAQPEFSDSPVRFFCASAEPPRRAAPRRLARAILGAGSEQARPPLARASARESATRRSCRVSLREREALPDSERPCRFQVAPGGGVQAPGPAVGHRAAILDPPLRDGHPSHALDSPAAARLSGSGRSESAHRMPRPTRAPCPATLRPRPRQHLQHERVVRPAVRVQAVRQVCLDQTDGPSQVCLDQTDVCLVGRPALAPGAAPAARRRARRAARPLAAGPARPASVVPAADAEAAAGLLEGGGGDSDCTGRVR